VDFQVVRYRAFSSGYIGCLEELQQFVTFIVDLLIIEIISKSKGEFLGKQTNYQVIQKI
jgi:hypothetical protein